MIITWSPHDLHSKSIVRLSFRLAGVFQIVPRRMVRLSIAGKMLYP